LVTHAHAVARPLRPEDAVAYLDGVRASASLTLLAATDRHGVVLRELATDTRPGRRLPPGLEVACVLREHGVRELLSTDRAMRRFAFLDVVDPLRDPGWEPTRAPGRLYRRLPRV
jgi:predicted nucleic acid-binding protein